MSSAASPQLALKFRTRGGPRPGAGRKPKRGGPGISHKRRPALPSRFPVHVTYRLVRRLPNARRPALFRAIRRAFNEGREAFGGRLCHFSVQKDHLHLIVEAANREALSRALQALAIRIARAINRALGRRGKVFADRYHLRILKTPTEVRAIGTDAAPSISQSPLAILNLIDVTDGQRNKPACRKKPLRRSWSPPWIVSATATAS